MINQNMNKYFIDIKSMIKVKSTLNQKCETILKKYKKVSHFLIFVQD